MATVNEAYEAAVKRGGMLGPVNVPIGMPTMQSTVSPAQRIAELAKQVADAGQELEMAREQFNRAQDARAMAAEAFINISERLMQAIHEHREGTPAGVPYRS